MWLTGNCMHFQAFTIAGVFFLQFCQGRTAFSTRKTWFVMAALWNRAGHHIFALSFLSSSSFFFFFLA